MTYPVKFVAFLCIMLKQNAMNNIQLFNSSLQKVLNLDFAPGIKAGFPSPADDYLNDSLDFNRDLIRHPEATF